MRMVLDPQVRGSHSLLNTMHLLNLRQMSGELLIAHRSPSFTLKFATVALEGFKGKCLPKAFASYDSQRSVF